MLAVIFLYQSNRNTDDYNLFDRAYIYIHIYILKGVLYVCDMAYIVLFFLLLRDEIEPLLLTPCCTWLYFYPCPLVPAAHLTGMKRFIICSPYRHTHPYLCKLLRANGNARWIIIRIRTKNRTTTLKSHWAEWVDRSRKSIGWQSVWKWARLSQESHWSRSSVAITKCRDEPYSCS